MVAIYLYSHSQKLNPPIHSFKNNCDLVEDMGIVVSDSTKYPTWASQIFHT